MEITEKEFWVNYWGNITLPQTVNYNFKNDRVIANAIKSLIPKTNNSQKAIEIGCAPGKWLVFLNKELGYHIDGYEYIDIAAQKTKENLLLNNIPENEFNIITGDFTQGEIKEKYDLVISLGFIEHFYNYNEILQKHCDILNDKGFLIIGLPNFKGINNYIQKIIDDSLDAKILLNHNLDTMELSVYKDFAKQNNLKILFSKYVGGFEPALFNNSKIKNPILKFFVKGIMKISSILFNNINTKNTASYILIILQK